METIAMYWEPKIKTYGFQIVRDLVLHHLVVPVHQSKHWQPLLETNDGDDVYFYLVSGQLNEEAKLRLSLLSKPDPEHSLLCRMKDQMGADDRCQWQLTTPVELLFFQGPHYGDRYGIADFTLNSLEGFSDRILTAVFSCASIYLVFPEGAADGLKDRLTDAFNIPK